MGIPHVERDILRGMTAKEFREWEMYAALDPFTELRADYRTALLAKTFYDVNVMLRQTLRALHGVRQKVVEKNLKLEDFLLNFKVEPKRKQTWQDQLMMLKIVGMQAILASKAGEAKE